MKLFAEVYLDEDVSILVAVLLRARGFDVLTTRDDNRLGQADPAQLARATALNRCMVTHNRIDFENLHRTFVNTELTHSGIIVATRRSPQETARRVAVLLNTFTADDLCNQLLYV